jgi:hypothetical protein
VVASLLGMEPPAARRVPQHRLGKPSSTNLAEDRRTRVIRRRAGPRCEEANRREAESS